MDGPEILARTLTEPGVTDKRGNRWQYHSRSDRHSQVVCWAILFDLLQQSEVLQDHFETGKVAFGLNHPMKDFKANRKKDLDLVVCTPASAVRRGKESFFSLAAEKRIQLTPKQSKALESFGGVGQADVGSVRIALEAKACMTAHVRARPRLYDELNSSHLTIHGAEEHAIAGGLVMVNIAPTFVSSDLNKFPPDRVPVEVSHHRQPADVERVIEKVTEIPRRVKPGEEGFDALGIIVVDCRNDGSPVEIEADGPAPKPGDIFHYDQLIRRMKSSYESRYR